MIGDKRLSIILLSYNDSRVVRAIQSIRRFDDINVVRIVVVDGGSTSEITQLLSDCLTSEDVLISEPDKGIFDALNKGLDACTTELIGWLGSDDLFTGKVLASQVVAALDKCDLFVANHQYFHDGYVTRSVHALPSRLGLVKYGLNNPHFATFGSATLLKSERFNLALRGSDIEYFMRLFDKNPRVMTTSVVATLQEEGGFSNSSYVGIFRTNFELLPLYAKYTNWFFAPLIIIAKLSFKQSMKIYFKIFRVRLQLQ